MAATTAAATTAFLPSGHRFADGLIGSGRQEFGTVGDKPVVIPVVGCRVPERTR